jgi:hypothetical protein
MISPLNEGNLIGALFPMEFDASTWPVQIMPNGRQSSVKYAAAALLSTFHGQRPLGEPAISP